MWDTSIGLTVLRNRDKLQGKKRFEFFSFFSRKRKLVITSTTPVYLRTRCIPPTYPNMRYMLRNLTRRYREDCEIARNVKRFSSRAYSCTPFMRLSTWYTHGRFDTRRDLWPFAIAAHHVQVYAYTYYVFTIHIYIYYIRTYALQHFIKKQTSKSYVQRTNAYAVIASNLWVRFTALAKKNWERGARQRSEKCTK